MLFRSLPFFLCCWPFSSDDVPYPRASEPRTTRCSASTRAGDPRRTRSARVVAPLQHTYPSCPVSPARIQRVPLLSLGQRVLPRCCWSARGMMNWQGHQRQEKLGTFCTEGLEGRSCLPVLQKSFRAFRVIGPPVPQVPLCFPLRHSHRIPIGFLIFNF